VSHEELVFLLAAAVSAVFLLGFIVGIGVRELMK